MRIRLRTIWCVIALIVFINIGIARLVSFLHLFFEHSGIPLTQKEALVAYHNDNLTNPRPQLIPKIIHQVFHNWEQPGNNTLPADWETVRQTCIDENPDFEVKLWTEESSWNFIAKEYPWFLNTYQGYRYNIQRVDAVRYFLLLHYGGIYIDLDNGCTTNLSPLLYYPVWVIDGARGALSNNILAAQPHHPFWSFLTQRLYDYDYNYLFPYVTVSYASGQWFETAVWEQYHSLLPDADDTPGQENGLYRLMMDDRVETADQSVFFSQARGGTWVRWDNRMFLWIGDHLFVVVFGALLLVVTGVWCCVRVFRRNRTSAGYTRLGKHAGTKAVELEEVA